MLCHSSTAAQIPSPTAQFVAAGCVQPQPPPASTMPIAMPFVTQITDMWSSSFWDAKDGRSGLHCMLLHRRLHGFMSLYLEIFWMQLKEKFIINIHLGGLMLLRSIPCVVLLFSLLIIQCFHEFQVLSKRTIVSQLR